MNSPLSGTCVVIFLVASLPAAAQFGVDAYPESPASKPLPASTATALPAPSKVESALPRAITMEDALDTINEYRAAAINDDAEYLLSIFAEPRKSEAADVIASKGLSYFISSGKPIVSWELECAACWEDEEEGAVCAITDELYTPSKHNNKYYQRLYVMKNIGDSTYITETPALHKKRARVLKKAMKKNNRDCKLDALAIRLENVDTGASTKEGATSLLKGIGSVLKALGN